MKSQDDTVNIKIRHILTWNYQGQGHPQTKYFWYDKCVE